MSRGAAVGRILVVEDDESGRELVVQALSRDGHEVQSAATATAARGLLGHLRVDLVVLDLGLPDADGLDLLTAIREEKGLPVVVLTGRDSLGDRVLGLDSGADDYLIKPVALAELQARVRALLRRARPRSARLGFGPLEIDLDAREARVMEEPLQLTRKEFGVLALLASNPRRVFTRDELLRAVWRSTAEYQLEATVTEHVRRLRGSLDSAAELGRWIVTVRGVGYRFEPDEDALGRE